jgi:DivIVA domain-containing protein
MAITVSDIEQKEFAYKGQGYDPYDVDQFLDQICDEMVALQERIEQLEAELAKARREVEVAQKAVRPIAPEVVRAPEAVRAPAPAPAVAQTSAALESILLNAQKLADQAVADAKAEAATIVREAQDKANETVKNAREEKATLEKNMETLRTAAKEFRKSFTELLDEQKTLMAGKLSLFGEE